MNPTPITTTTLHDRRVAVGLSLRRLSELAQVSMSMVQLLDNGYRPRHSDCRDRIEAVLDQLEAEPEAERFVKFDQVREHLELGPPVTDGPRAA